MTSISLRYGTNPHQTPASFRAPDGALAILNGKPSYINILDALTGWQITRDLVTGGCEIAAASMKHCTPVGVAVPGEVDAFTNALLKPNDLTAATCAYLRARSADWGAAYGDIAVVLSHIDGAFARQMARLASDGIVAASYSEEAIRILRRKKKGTFLIVRIDPSFDPEVAEQRTVFGVTIQQPRNTYVPTGLLDPSVEGSEHARSFGATYDARSSRHPPYQNSSESEFRVVHGNPDAVQKHKLEIAIGAAIMKYTVSNNIALLRGGRAVSVCAGQQSRILATRIACEKYASYVRLQQPAVIQHLGGIGGKLVDRIASAVGYCQETRPEIETSLRELGPATLLASDGSLPFPDNVDVAAAYGIGAIVEPEGALRSAAIAAAAAGHGVELIRSRHRYFYH